MVEIVPPIKCQGIKTKLVPMIRLSVPQPIKGRWIEPFCGSCVVAINVQPERALLTDANPHIIRFYQDIQQGVITPAKVRSFLQYEGEKLRSQGEKHYYEIRQRFNSNPNSLDFLFLNRSCFNGVMRFNQKGAFNVPFCRKPDRFSPAYITKITNQVSNFTRALYKKDYEFRVSDFRDTLAEARSGDIVYVDPPYAGRHVDYFNTWSEEDEEKLIYLLKNLPSKFIFSTWHSNKYRVNPAIEQHWQDERYDIKTIEHFYHVGATEDLRNAMLEALISNFRNSADLKELATARQQTLDL